MVPWTFFISFIFLNLPFIRSQDIYSAENLESNGLEQIVVAIEKELGQKRYDRLNKIMSNNSVIDKISREYFQDLSSDCLPDFENGIFNSITRFKVIAAGILSTHGETFYIYINIALCEQIASIYIFQKEAVKDLVDLLKREVATSEIYLEHIFFNYVPDMFFISKSTKNYRARLLRDSCLKVHFEIRASWIFSALIFENIIYIEDIEDETSSKELAQLLENNYILSVFTSEFYKRHSPRFPKKCNFYDIFIRRMVYEGYPLLFSGWNDIYGFFKDLNYEMSLKAIFSTMFNNMIPFENFKFSDNSEGTEWQSLIQTLEHCLNMGLLDSKIERNIGVFVFNSNDNISSEYFLEAYPRTKKMALEKIDKKVFDAVIIQQTKLFKRIQCSGYECCFFKIPNLIKQRAARLFIEN